MRMIVLSSLLLILVGCRSTTDVINDIHKNDWQTARAEATRYLKVLAGDRFDTVVAAEDLEPLFDRQASYRETAEAARRAIRWRIDMANNQYESGAINLSLILSALLAKKIEVEE